MHWSGASDGRAVVTALLLALFVGAALLAIGSLAMSARKFAAAVLAIGRQLDECTTRPSPKLGGEQGRQKSASLRRKARLTARTNLQKSSTGRNLQRSRKSSARFVAGLGDNSRRRQFGYGIVLVPEPLVLD